MDKVERLKGRMKGERFSVPESSLLSEEYVRPPEWNEGPVTIAVDPLWSSTLSEYEPEAFEDFEMLDTKYPEVGAFLKNKSEKWARLPVGEISIWKNSINRPDYIEETPVPVFAGAAMMKDVLEVMQKLAIAIENKDNYLHKAEFFLGVSRLGSVAKHLGFDVFPLKQDATASHISRFMMRNAYESSGASPETAAQLSQKRHVALAVISKKKLLELYGNR